MSHFGDLLSESLSDIFISSTIFFDFFNTYFVFFMIMYSIERWSIILNLFSVLEFKEITVLLPREFSHYTKWHCKRHSSPSINSLASSASYFGLLNYEKDEVINFFSTDSSLSFLWNNTVKTLSPASAKMSASYVIVQAISLS